MADPKSLMEFICESIDEALRSGSELTGRDLYIQARNKTLEADAFEIRQRAERRIGEMMAEQRDTVGMAKPPGDNQYGRMDRVSEKPEAPVTLAEAGIDKNLADRARKAASVPLAKFEELIVEGRERIANEANRITKRILDAGSVELTRGVPVVQPPPGRYSCIVVDPPWPMEKIERDVRPNQTGFEYPTMTEDELAEFDLPAMAADDCHLFCWTTHRFLPMAFRLPMAAIWLGRRGSWGGRGCNRMAC
jgi:MT-A70 protein